MDGMRPVAIPVASQISSASAISRVGIRSHRPEIKAIHAILGLSQPIFPKPAACFDLFHDFNRSFSSELLNHVFQIL
jgi:hypothetical protein